MSLVLLPRRGAGGASRKVTLSHARPTQAPARVPGRRGGHPWFVSQTQDFPQLPKHRELPPHGPSTPVCSSSCQFAVRYIIDYTIYILHFIQLQIRNLPRATTAYSNQYIDPHTPGLCSSCIHSSHRFTVAHYQCSLSVLSVSVLTIKQMISQTCVGRPLYTRVLFTRRFASPGPNWWRVSLCSFASRVHFGAA